MERHHLPNLREAWPADGLEQLGRCPVCGVAERTLLHSDLQDRIFFAAPGTWTMWKCSGCGSAYLDPRPDERTIDLAYRTYYTHAPSSRPEAQNAFQRLRNLLGNDYRNATYGTHYRPSLPGGRIATALAPSIKRRIDVEFRFLPSRAGVPKRVLDIGCGNGSFLKFARDADWETAGVEPDPSARAVAGAAGFDVRPSLGDWKGAGAFGYVTLSHVIEHVHDPLSVIRRAFELLATAGRIFIDTPNVDAPGHRIYGPAWRGLEPPRHLILFSQSSLRDSLERAGFRNLQFIERPDVVDFMAEQSRRIAAGLDPYSNDPLDDDGRPSGKEAASGTGGTPEFLTVIAEKP